MAARSKRSSFIRASNRDFGQVQEVTPRSTRDLLQYWGFAHDNDNLAAHLLSRISAVRPAKSLDGRCAHLDQPRQRIDVKSCLMEMTKRYEESL